MQVFVKNIDNVYMMYYSKLRMTLKVTFSQFRKKLAFYLKELANGKKVAIYDGRNNTKIITLKKAD